MSIVLVEVSVDSVSIEEGSPDDAQSLILEHLVRYCSKFTPLPAIGILLEGTTAKVVRGHKFLLASRLLNRPTIRAVVTGSPDEAVFQSFVARSKAKVLDWAAIKAAEEREPVLRAWHVFFFARPLSFSEKTTFDTAVMALFADPHIHMSHDDVAAVAEFEALTPFTDHEWARRHFAAVSAFSRDYVRILSYQGRAFEHSAREPVATQEIDEEE